LEPGKKRETSRKISRFLPVSIHIPHSRFLPIAPISTDDLPATWRYIRPTDCRSARPRTSRPTVELLIVINDQNISVRRTDHSTDLTIIRVGSDSSTLL